MLEINLEDLIENQNYEETVLNEFLNYNQESLEDSYIEVLNQFRLEQFNSQQMVY